MIRATGRGKNGRTLLVLGLDRENITRLTRGEPILVEAESCGATDVHVDVFIMFGETLAGMTDQLRGAGIELPPIVDRVETAVVHVFIGAGIAAAPEGVLGVHVTQDPTDTPKQIPLSWSLSFAPTGEYAPVLCHVHFEGEMPSERDRETLREKLIAPVVRAFLFEGDG